MTRLFPGLAAAVLLAACATPALPASISIVSMQYSAAHPVPHLHYEGQTEDGDLATLKQMYERFVACDLSCSGPDGMPTAVLTMNGPGGSYAEGLALADFLRANHIATVVERDMQCYSACAFAFLGGSAWSSQEGVGTYIDRMVEPGSTVGFHAPYSDENSFMQALSDRGAMAAQGDTRNSLALMVKELVKWNVDPEVLFYMVGMGPDDTYNLRAADDLYLARVALPPTPPDSWIVDIKEAVRNVCARLLAIDEKLDPLDVVDRLQTEWIDGIGEREYSGPISGYRLGDRLLDIGSCAITEESMQTAGDYEVALYFTPGIMGFNAAGTSFFNRVKGWSSAGAGGNPLKRILQKGPMNHYFLPMGVDMDSLDLPGEIEIEKNKYVVAEPPAFASLPEGMTIAEEAAQSRISYVGNVFLFERTGPGKLYEDVFSTPALGRTYVDAAVGDDGMFREGTYDADGALFTQFGFRSGDTSIVMELAVIPPDGAAPTSEDYALLEQVRCSVGWQGSTLSCS
jgi:hypothetical protein